MDFQLRLLRTRHYQSKVVGGMTAVQSVEQFRLQYKTKESPEWKDVPVEEEPLGSLKHAHNHAIPFPLPKHYLINGFGQGEKQIDHDENTGLKLEDA